MSLFAGVLAGGFDLALQRCGVKVVAAVEIDPDCRGVLSRHFPETTLFDDVRTVTGDDLRAAGFVPDRGLVTAGFPCQDLSIAGRRAGLGGARSGLFWEIMRLADELSPRWLLLENVPGLLSAVCACPGSSACVDNGRVVDGGCGEWRPASEPAAAERLGAFFALHKGKWYQWFPEVPHVVTGGTCPAGCMAAHGGAMGTVLGALGERGLGVAYRVLDSRFFGVAQRRERVFIVSHSGDWGAPAEVLLEPESGAGHPPQGAAEGTRVAGTLAASAGSGGLGGIGQSGNSITSRLIEAATVTGTLTSHMLGDYDDNTARGGFMVMEPVAATLQGGGKRGHRVDAEGAAGGHLVVSALQAQPGWAGPGSDAEGAAGGHLIPVAPLPSRDVSADATSREGKGADSDATSGNLIVQPVALRGRADGNQAELGDAGDPAFTLRTPSGGSSYPMIVRALTSEGADASEDGTGRGTTASGVPRPVPMAFNPQTGGDMRLGFAETPTALQASQVTGVLQPMGVSENQRGEVLETPYSRQLTTGGGKPGQGYGAVRVPVSTLSADGYDETHADATEARARQVLRALRDAVGTQDATIWAIGVAVSLQPTEVLQPLVHGESVRCSPGEVRSELGHGAPSFTEDGAAGTVCLVWQAGRERRAPPEWRLDGQLAGELGAYLSQLSHEGTPEARHLYHLRQAAEGAGLLRHALPALQEARRPGEGTDANPQNMHGMRGTSALQVALREALHAGEASGDASDKLIGGRGVSHAVRRLTPRLP